MPSINLPELELNIFSSSVGVTLASYAARAITLPELRARLVLGGLQQKFSERFSPAWQTTAPMFVGQLSADGHYYYPKGLMPGTMQRIKVREGTSVTRRGRFVAEDGTLILLANARALTYRLFRVTGSTAEELESESLSPSLVMYNELHKTAGWRKDATGFTFEHTVDGARLVDGGHIYRVEYVLETDSGELLSDAFEVEMSGLYTPPYELA